MRRRIVLLIAVACVLALAWVAVPQGKLLYLLRAPLILARELMELASSLAGRLLGGDALNGPAVGVTGAEATGGTAEAAPDPAASPSNADRPAPQQSGDKDSVAGTTSPTETATGVSLTTSPVAPLKSVSGGDSGTPPGATEEESLPTTGDWSSPLVPSSGTPGSEDPAVGGPDPTPTPLPNEDPVGPALPPLEAPELPGVEDLPSLPSEPPELPPAPELPPPPELPPVPEIPSAPEVPSGPELPAPPGTPSPGNEPLPAPPDPNDVDLPSLPELPVAP